MVTKTKGLKDILDLFTNNDTDDYGFLLKHWTKVFLNLANDDDFQVRENALSTLEQINKLVKSQLQPFLKQIVAHWLCLTGDPHGNVAKFASQAFSSTFSKNKLNEVFLFSKEPIVGNVDTILFKTNYNEKKNEIRLIPGAFYSLIVLSKIAKDDEYINGELVKVLENSVFWKYSKFNDNGVQVSWFNLINSLLQIRFDLIKNYITKITQQTFNRLGDKNASVQENVWRVMFTLMKLDEETCFKELNYEKVHKSFNGLLKNSTSSFSSELLVSNFDLLLNYFVSKNENEEEFIGSLFDQFEHEILNNKNQTLAIDLYFKSLLYLAQNQSGSTLPNQTIFNEQIDQKLKFIIEQISSDSRCLQELFKKLVNFSSNLKTLNLDEQVQLVNDLILKSVSNKLEISLRDEFDFQSIKSLLNIIFNLKAYQSKKKLNLFTTDGLVESMEFIKYKFEFYAQTDDLSTKKDLLKEILKIVFDRDQTKISNNFIEFLNYLVQFSSYLDVLNDLQDRFVKYFKAINHQLANRPDQNSSFHLSCIVQQFALNSSKKIDFNNILDLNKSTSAFSFVVTLQLFKGDDKIDLITEDVLSIYDVLFDKFVNCSTELDRRHSLDELELDDEDEDKLVKKLVGQLTDQNELNLLNAIYSLLALNLNDSTYETMFTKLVNLDCNDEMDILIYLILNHLNKTNKVLPVRTIECLLYKFIEFTNQKMMELNRNLWSDVLFKSLKQSKSDESSNVINNLSSKFKQLLLSRKSITFDQLNLVISSIYTFVVKLSALDEYSNQAALDEIVLSILLDENVFKQFKGELNEKVFEFLWIKNDFVDYDFSTSTLTDELKVPHLVHVSYASLKIAKLLNFTNTQLNLENLMNESTDQEIVSLFETNSGLEYLFNYSNLSYCYLKILNQIYSYGMSLRNPTDLVENYIHFYEHIYSELDDGYVKSYATRTYQSDYENIWTVLSLHHLLNAVGVENVFHFENISKSLKINNFSLIMKYIPKHDLELFVEQVIQYNLVSKANYPDNFDDIQEYLNIIAICLKNYLVTIDHERNLNPIVNCILSHQSKDDKFYFNYSNDQSLEEQLNDTKLIETMVSVVHFLDQVLKRSSDDLSSKFTDFLFYSLLKWTQILDQDVSLLINNNRICNYLNCLFSLINTVAFLMQLNTSNLRKARSNWLENYSFKVNERLFRFFIKLSRLEIKFALYDMVNTLGRCLIEIDNDSLIKVQFKDIDLEQFNDWKPTVKILDNEEDSSANLKLSTKLERVFNVLSSLMMNRNSLYSLTSHELIKNYLFYLAHELNHDQDFLADLDDKLYLKPPAFLLDLMDKINEQLHQTESNFDEHTNSLKIVYFLVWEQLIEFWSKLNEQTKCTIANYLKDQGVLDDLFIHFNDILPIDKQLLEVYYKHGLTKSKIMDYFLNTLKLDSASLWSANTLYHLSCQIYLKIFTKMPTTVRLWINTSANQTLIKQFTQNFVSDIVIQNELKVIQREASNSLESLRLKVRPSTNEIAASYSFEDCKIELTLTLPNNYPIGIIKINAGERVGVDVAKWRSFEFQLHTFLEKVKFDFRKFLNLITKFSCCFQNGSVFDGIVVWLNNIKKTLEHCEECMICFYVLASSNYQLPRVQCHSCSKRFHR